MSPPSHPFSAPENGAEFASNSALPQPYRSTDATVFTPIEGQGSTQIDGQTIEWSARDVFVVPSWATVRHRASADAVLFSFSDRPVQQATGLFREERIA